jgi:hypothetical protein
MKVQWGPLVKETADRISHEIGHRPVHASAWRSSHSAAVPRAA